MLRYGTPEGVNMLRNAIRRKYQGVSLRRNIQLQLDDQSNKVPVSCALNC